MKDGSGAYFYGCRQGEQSFSFKLITVMVSSSPSVRRPELKGVYPLGNSDLNELWVSDYGTGTTSSKKTPMECFSCLPNSCNTVLISRTECEPQ